ncbi:MAG: nuclear transport factor 2 family protein [bacterium]
MNTQENTRIVKDVLAAFVRGDIPAILNSLTDDVEWFIPGPPDRVAFSGSRRGREQVMQFFIALDATIEFLKFEPRDYVAEGDKVVAFGHNEDRMKATNRFFGNDWACLFVVRDGKIAKVRMYEDTAAFVMALEPQSNKG